MTALTTFHTAARKTRGRSRRGLTLFGVLMALGLAAAAVVGTVVLYNTATEVQNRNDTQALITALVIATHRIHQGTSTYGNSTNLVPLLDDRGAIPGSARTATGTIRHAFGGTVTVVSTTAGERFEVTLNALQEANCSQVLDPYIGQTRQSGSLYAVEASLSTEDDDLADPLTASDVSRICEAAAGAATNLELTFE